MKVTKISSINPGNPFLSDFEHMGVQLGTNIMAMMMTHTTQKMTHLIIVDMETGERLRIDF